MRRLCAGGFYKKERVTMKIYTVTDRGICPLWPGSLRSGYRRSAWRRWPLRRCLSREWNTWPWSPVCRACRWPRLSAAISTAACRYRWAGATAIIQSSTAWNTTGTASSTWAPRTLSCWWRCVRRWNRARWIPPCVKAFRVPAGTLVEVYATTLHYAPLPHRPGQGIPDAGGAARRHQYRKAGHPPLHR